MEVCPTLHPDCVLGCAGHAVPGLPRLSTRSGHRCVSGSQASTAQALLAPVAASGPLCAAGRGADSVLSLDTAGAPQLCAGGQILCSPGQPTRGPSLASLPQMHPPGRGQQRLPRPRCHSCRSPACGRAGLGDQPRFRDSGFMGLGAQGRGQWGLGCGQTALRKGPSAWWLNPETLPPVGGGQCPGRQPPLRLPSGLQLWEAPPFFTTPPAWLLP